MQRLEWLKKMRTQAEALYDHLAPAYWIRFGLYANAAHSQFIEKCLDRLDAPGEILDAACGAGRYDGRLLEAGHSVLGIDQSGFMLARAREIYPTEGFLGLLYARMGLQEMDFQAEFDGAICVDALEHVPPEDWPGIMARFNKALKPDGFLFITVELAEWRMVSDAFERAKAQGLPVVLGEVVDGTDTAYAMATELDWQAISGEQVDLAVYHYYPTLVMVRTWLKKAGLEIEEEGTGDGYAHFLAVKGV